MNPYSLIISDLHLSQYQPEVSALFFNFLATHQGKAEALYILGDFVEYWIGDDDLSPFHQQLIAVLKTLVNAGTKLWMMQGNRDFLLGSQFMKLTGAEFLADPSVVDFYGTPILLMHGDLLCTDDLPYLRYRRIVHQPWLQWLFLRLPLTWRRKLALKLRQVSYQNYQRKKCSQPTKGEVTSGAVLQALQNSSCHLLIHGHTHRLGMHYYPNYRRLVLSDWHQYASFIRLDSTRIILGFLS